MKSENPREGTQSASEPAPHSDGPRRDCIVAVDDDAIIRQMLDSALSARYRLVCLPNGDEVIRAVETHRPRLVLLDITLPGSDGYEVCESIREQARFQRLPILFMTARVDDASFLHGLASGGNAFILKPFEAGALRRRVDAMLRAYPGA